VQLSIYIRIPDPTTMPSDSRDCNHLSHDIYLGHVKLEPNWDEQMQDDWFPLHGGSGKIRVQLAYRRGGVRTLEDTGGHIHEGIIVWNRS
jgi:serum/glucocorticoid-regulated kinase 2